MSRILPPTLPQVAGLEPYKPGKPIEELERELGIKGAIKLASNENPLGPSPKAQAAVKACAANLHRYPDGAGYELRKALSGQLGLPMAQIILGNGSNELIEFLCRAFVHQGDEALAAQYAFLMYDKLVTVAGGRLIEVPLKGFAIDLDAILAAVTPQTRLIFLNSPHNPAGTAISQEALSGFLAQVPPGVLVVLDEAYIDFADDPQVARGHDFLDSQTPVLVMRTFSKSAGLAGCRIAYGLGPVEVTDILNRVRQPFNTSIPAQAAALAALGDTEHLARTLAVTREGRETFYACFRELGFAYVPSQANFVTVRLGPRAGEVADLLLRRGVIVRKMASYGLDEYLRISVGLPEENQRFTTELRAIWSELG